MIASIGRPRDTNLDRALIRATEELIIERGFGAVSVGAIAARAQTSRPAFYRRFDGISEVVLSMLLDRFAVDLGELIDTGALPTDLEAVQREQVQLFSDPLVASSLAGFLNSAHTDAQLRTSFARDFLGPRRAGVATVVTRAIARAEIPPEPDIEWICDLLTGPMLMRVIMPGLNGFDEAFISQTVNSALSALKYSVPERSAIGHVATG